jgi:hypothetical protein
MVSKDLEGGCSGICEGITRHSSGDSERNEISELGFLATHLSHELAAPETQANRVTATPAC